MKLQLVVFCFLLISIFTFSQNQIERLEVEKPKHRMAFILGHSYVSIHNNELLAIPTFGLDYEYWFNDHWGIGVFSDVELITKELSPSINGESIEREYPVVMTLDAVWSPIRHWELVVGPGFISERGEMESLVRMGLEHDLTLGHHWDVAINFFYDKKFDGNYAMSIGIGIAKGF